MVGSQNNDAKHPRSGLGMFVGNLPIQYGNVRTTQPATETAENYKKSTREITSDSIPKTHIEPLEVSISQISEAYPISEQISDSEIDKVRLVGAMLVVKTPTESQRDLEAIEIEKVLTQQEEAHK